MRRCTPASLCLAAAAALLPDPAHAGPQAAVSVCATADDRDFPVTTRIHGGPDTYRPGGGYGTWYLDLTNTTTRTCSGLHPVVVLVDAERSLRPAQPRLEFYDGARPRPVRFATTDEDELVGAFTGEDDDFPGFTVGPGRTLSVKVRLAVARDAVPNEVTANAAVVQRHADDGDWVGQSNDYRFAIGTGPTGTGSSPPPVPDPSATAPAGRLPFADELAGTGRGRMRVLLAAAAILLASGTALLLAARGRRRP
ncbi:hypothetical protein GCM10010129_13710 [Streptomyces fumigatiscleroticus]|nr:hypothetical protein GCM10010129_13710 [Streptomyces fumigatiscleroticus]